ncbi:MAG: 30S ribosome-binding factor RbfA [Deltaproteobacteria bacterium]|jgi:ribosome-binding factor A|nr:30S ribosome-binding factor RbfA [Deltaproteobacteria bacterium]
MSQRRLDKINRQLLAQVSELLLFRSSDPRLKWVNVTRASVSGDTRRAKIYYSVLGDGAAREAAGLALKKAAGFVRSRLAESLGLRVTPEIDFAFDPNYEYAQRLGHVLADLKPGQTPDPALASSSATIDRPASDPLVSDRPALNHVASDQSASAQSASSGQSDALSDPDLFPDARNNLEGRP